MLALLRRITIRQIALIACLLLCVTTGWRGLTWNLANLGVVSALMQDRAAVYPQASSYLQGVLAIHSQRYAEAIPWLQQSIAERPVLVRWYLAQARNGAGD